MAIPVRPYQRTEHGHAQAVREYLRAGAWIGEPKWQAGQREWAARGHAARSRDWTQDIHAADAENRRVLSKAAAIYPSRVKAGAPIASKISALHSALADPDSHLLEFDPANEHAVIAFGDPTTAKHVITYVPGAGTTLATTAFDADKSRAMRAETERKSGESAATVFWLGYHPPRTAIGALTKGEAVRSGRDLAAFQHKLKTAHKGPAHYTVLGHSYGSVVAGEAAARHGMRPHDMVLLGSPGVGVRHVRELGVPQEHVWAGVNPADPVSKVSGALSADFGGNPAAPKFGARAFNALGHEVPAASPRWERFEGPHHAYWDPGSPSLHNLASIMAGHYKDVDAGKASQAVLTALVALAQAEAEVRSYDRVVKGRVQHVRAHPQRVAARQPLGEPQPRRQPYKIEDLADLELHPEKWAAVLRPGQPAQNLDDALRPWIGPAKWKEGQREWVIRGEQAWNQHSDRWEFVNDNGTQGAAPHRGGQAVAHDGKTRVLGEVKALLGPDGYFGHAYAVVDSEDTGMRYLVRTIDGHVENYVGFQHLTQRDPAMWGAGILASDAKPREVPPTVSVHPNPAIKSHDPALVEDLLHEDESTGIAALKRPGEDVTIEQGGGTMNYFGASADTKIVTFKDGSQWIRKRDEDDAMQREMLTARISDIIGAGAPEAIREGNELWQPKLEAISAVEWLGGTGEAEEPLGNHLPGEMYHTPEGYRIGILDHLIGNNDRHYGNWMVAKDENGREYPVPIDHGLAFLDYNTDSRFAAAVHLKELADIPDATWAEWLEKVQALEPEFDKLEYNGHRGYTWVIDHLRSMRAQAARNRNDRAKDAA